ncbi:MAG: HAMP domain-containing protein [Chloroflexi bacterium]|nr:HAMP domain-containing protein [Chloroflexota bacterium]
MFQRRFRHTSIRSKLTATYIAGALLAALLGFTVYHVFVQPADWAAQIVEVAQQPGNLWLVGLLIVAALGVSVCLGYLMARSFNRQIEALAAGAHRIASGDLATRIAVHSEDELAQLAGTFNDMAARLQASLDQQQKLEQARRDIVANVAHDLRTPLAAVQAAVEALEEGVVEDAATATQYLATVSRETRYLGRLIDDLFALSQLEAGQFPLEPIAVYVEDLVQDCLTGLLPQLDRTGVTLKIDLPATLPPVHADRHATRRVLINLLQNALTFTPGGGQIAVSGAAVDTSRDGLPTNMVKIEVSDSGPGIPAADLQPGPDGQPRIFERFYRGDKARSGSGAGLGLAIANELIHAQGGRMWVTSVPGEGTTIGFTLPRSN